MHLLDYGKALCGKGRTSARAGLRHGPKRRHMPDFGKVGLRRIPNIRRMPDFGKALFSGIWAFLAGIWAGARPWGAASRPKGRQAARLKTFR